MMTRPQAECGDGVGVSPSFNIKCTEFTNSRHLEMEKGIETKVGLYYSTTWS